MGQSFNRKVLYIPGYDPIHPRRYRELYRAEAAAQAAISGYYIHLSAKTGPGGYGWFVDSEIDGRSTRAEFEVMLWSDLVRASMCSGILATYGQMLRTAYIYIASGASVATYAAAQRAGDRGTLSSGDVDRAGGCGCGSGLCGGGGVEPVASRPFLAWARGEPLGSDGVSPL